MNTRFVCGVFGLLATAAACGPSVSAPESGGTTLAAVGGGGSGDEGGGGGGVPTDVASAIDDTKQQLADLDAKLAKGDDVVVLSADRLALASYLADLNACAGGEVACPPFAEPSLKDGATIEELASDACACRTRACADQVLDALNTLGDQSDPDGAQAETTARECVHRRLGNDRVR